MNYLLKNPQIRREWLTRLKFGAILLTYKGNEKNILSGIYNLIFLILARVLLSGTHLKSTVPDLPLNESKKRRIRNNFNF